MSLILNVEILGEFRNLTAATQGAQTQLQNMNQKASSVSSSIKGALGAIGVGFSLAVITRQFEEMSKAAIEDAKSADLLALAMKNTGKATDDTVAAAERNIAALSKTAAIADDNLRPAYQKLFIATQDNTRANDLLKVALDASAGTGKSLDVVVQAMSKSFAGSDTALVKLVPSIKGANDPLGVLAKTFHGAALAAANLDPYQQMTVAMGEVQESIGVLLLPIIRDLSANLVKMLPEIQAFFKNLGDPATPLGKAWNGLGEAFGNVGTALKNTFASGKTDTEAFITVLNTLKTTLEAVANLINIINGKTAGNWGANLGASVNQFFTGSTATPTPTALPPVATAPIPVPKFTSTPVTVNISTPVTSSTIIKTVQGFQKATGTTLAQALK